MSLLEYVLRWQSWIALSHYLINSSVIVDEIIIDMQFGTQWVVSLLNDATAITHVYASSVSYESFKHKQSLWGRLVIASRSKKCNLILVQLPSLVWISICIAYARLKTSRNILVRWCLKKVRDLIFCTLKRHAFSFYFQMKIRVSHFCMNCKSNSKSIEHSFAQGRFLAL